MLHAADSRFLYFRHRIPNSIFGENAPGKIFPCLVGDFSIEYLPIDESAQELV